MASPLDWLQQMLGGTMGEMPQPQKYGTLVPGGALAPPERPGVLDRLGQMLSTPAWDQVQQSDEATRALIDQGRYADATRQGLDNPMLGAFGGNIRGVGAPIRAYHGSPHDFDRFDLSKIGTGEGAQAYGHGLYFAENEGVARGYRDALALGEVRAPGSAINLSADPQLGKAARHLYIANGDYDLAAKRIRQLAPDAEPALSQLKEMDAAPFAGRMYEVDIHADPQRFLDWDRALSGQPEVLPALQRAGWATDRMAATPGSEIIRQYNEVAPGGEFAANKLRDAGIPGIRYLDQGSRIDPAAIERKIALHEGNLRAGGGSAAERAEWTARIEALKAELAQPQTHNYVMFDPSLVEIMRKYGLLPPVAAGGLLGAAQGDEAAY